MEKNRDLRRPNVSTVNGLPRRRQRITTLRDSSDQDRQMDLQETVRLGDREQLHNKDREREFSKRRRVDRSSMVQHRSDDDAESNRENESMDSSDEEYYEEEEDTRINRNRTSPTSSSLSNNRRGLRTFRSSPVLRGAADEMFGVPIPRRARSSSTKRLHDYCNLATGVLPEELSHRRFSPSSVSLIGCGSASPSSSGASMKKKTKSVDRRTPIFGSASNSKTAAIQDDIEIEVAEALFDLMKQSQSQFQSSQRQEKVDRDGKNTASDEIKMSKADGGKDENNAFSVHNEPSIKVNAETVSSDSLKELKREGRIAKGREKFPDDPARELVNGDGFVNKVKVGPPIEIESPSCVKVNACDIQDPTMTKAHYETTIAESKREAKLEIDLMALPSSPQSRERDALVELGTDTEMINQVVLKKSESISKDGQLIGMHEEKIGVIDSSQLRIEKHRHSDILNVSNSAAQGRKEQKNQSPTSLLTFPIGMSSWPGVIPHPGYMPPIQAVLPLNGSAKSSMIMQPPQFKFSQRRAKRCATHQFLAHNINNHQELIKKCLSSGSTAKSSNTKYTFPSAQNFIAGNPYLGEFQGGQNLATVSAESVKDKSSDAAIAFDPNGTTNGKSVLQQAPHQAATSSFLRGSGFVFPFSHHQTTMMAPANSAGPPQSSASSVGITSLPSNPAGRHSVNMPLPNASASMSLNHPLFPSNEAYMAVLQNSGCTIPMPSFKGGTPSLPFFNPSLYHSPMFNVTQNQQHIPIPPQTTNSSSHKQQTVSTNSQQSGKPSQLPHISSKPEIEINRKTGASVDHPQQGSKGRIDIVPQAFASSFGSSASTTPALHFSSMPQNSPMFHMLPEMSWIGNQTVQQKSFNFPKSDCKEISMGPPKFDGLTRSINYLPASLGGTQQQHHHHHQQQQLIQAQNSQMHQLQQLSGTAQVNKSSGPNTINGSFFPSIFTSNSPPIFTIANDSSSSPPQLMKNSHGQTHIAIPATPSIQGHNNNSLMKNDAPSSRNINQRSASSTGTFSAQEGEAGSSQKTSPACRRNVPSILSMGPSPLPQLKY